jgi:ATP-binding cassette subfamily D (ALD) protein 2
MNNETYYKVGNLDSRLANADQCLTEDISKFCANLAHLHSQLSKPILDVILMGFQLFRYCTNFFITIELVFISMNKNKQDGGGFTAFTLAMVVVFATAKVLKLVQPPFGKLVAEEGRLSGELRYVHSRLITNAEEIAFYRGHKIELNILDVNQYLSLNNNNLIFFFTENIHELN